MKFIHLLLKKSCFSSTFSCTPHLVRHIFMIINYNEMGGVNLFKITLREDFLKKHLFFYLFNQKIVQSPEPLRGLKHALSKTHIGS